MLSLALCGPVVISEVMVDPDGTDSPNEFVELVNRGDTAVDLTGWRIGDLNSTDELSSLDNLILEVSAYALIFEGDYSLDSGIYADIILAGTKILFVDDNSIGDGLANGADSLFLMDSTGAIVDRMGWDQPSASGYTLEKVQLDTCANPRNWRPSLVPRGTPGDVNSVANMIFDLALDSLHWRLVDPPNQFALTAFVTNKGFQATTGQIGASQGELAFIPEVAIESTIPVNFDWTGPDSVLGLYRTPFWVSANRDYDAANDTLSVELYLPSSVAAVVINEIMYTPFDQDPEWVELVNVTTNSINLERWEFRDQSRGTTLPYVILNPGEYLVLAGDSLTASGWPPGITLVTPAGFPGLNNSGEQITLADPYSAVIDQLDYTSQSITPFGMSLEKVVLTGGNQAANWRPSLVLHGTPGTINSVAGQLVDLALDSLHWTFEPAAGRFSLAAFVSNPGLAASTGRIFAAGAAVADITLLAPGEERMSNFTWTPPLSYGQLDLPVRIEAAGDYAAANDSLLVKLLVPAVPLAVVINEIMFAPPGNGPEWVELLVNTGRPVNPENWTLSDSTGGTILPAGLWAPGDLVVVTGDSTLATTLPLNAGLVVVAGFPTLNNGGDIISLVDPSGVILDRVDYGLMDLSGTGRSLERVSPQVPSNDPRSWRPSPDAGGHTAGRPNATTATPEDLGLTIEPNPLRLNRPESRLVLTYATPFASINLQATIYDLAGRRVATIHNGGPLPGTGEVSWDARDLNPVRYKTGQYLLVFKAVDTGSTQIWERVERLILVK